LDWWQKRKRTEKMVLVALFSALTWIGAYLRVEIIPPVPFTLQNLMVIMAGVLLGPRYAPLSQLVYLLLGLVGVPVFSQGGGLSYIFRPGFGFVLGFVGAAAVVGALSALVRKPTFLKCFGLTLTGMLVIYLIALPYLYFLNHLVLNEPVSLGQLALGLTPFLLGDLIKALLIAGLIPPLWRRLPEI
jgi:biotin transport system substrate-specific component